MNLNEGELVMANIFTVHYKPQNAKSNYTHMKNLNSDHIFLQIKCVRSHMKTFQNMHKIFNSHKKFYMKIKGLILCI